MSTLIYNFGDNTADGGAELKHLLGGKGANLGEMSRLGLPAPRMSHVGAVGPVWGPRGGGRPQV